MELKEENFRKIADDLPFGLYIVGRTVRSFTGIRKRNRLQDIKERKWWASTVRSQDCSIWMKRDEAFANFLPAPCYCRIGRKIKSKSYFSS